MHLRLPRPFVLVGLLAAGPGCSDSPQPDAASGTAGPAATTSAEVGIEWLDDEARAAGVTHHRIAGQLTAPRSQGDTLRKLARDALVDRARSLGFRRLDNLQIETSCADDAPDGTACIAKVVAIASR